MAVDLERLIVTLEAQNAKYIQKLDQADKKLTRFRAQTKKNLQGISLDFKTILGGVAVGLLVRKLVTLGKESAKAADANAKFADTIGLTTEQLAGYQLAAEISGVQTEQFNKGITRLQKNIGDAEAGLATAVREFDKLGVSAEQLKNLSTDEQIKLIAERFRQLPSTVDRASVSLNLFGRSGLALGVLFDEGAEGIERFQQEAIDLGIALSRVDAARIEAANDAMTRAGKVQEALGNALAVELAPIIAAVANEFVEAAKEAGGFGKMVLNVVDNAATAVGLLANVVYALRLEFLGVRAATRTAFEALQSPQKFESFLARLLGNEDPNKGIAQAKGLGEKFRDEFYNAVLEGAPSERIKKFIDDARKEMDAAVKDKTGRPLPGVGGAGGAAGSTAELDAVISAEEKYREKLAQRGEALRTSLLPAGEQYKEQLAEINTLLMEDAISQETYSRALANYKEELAAALPGIQSLAELNEALTDTLTSQEQALIDVRQRILDLTLAADQFPAQADAIAVALGNLEKAESDLIKGTQETGDTMSAFAVRAAENMQDAFAQFLFDPFSDGLDGMLEGFLKVIQQMVAQQAAAMLFDPVSKGGMGGNDLIKSAVSSLAGLFPGYSGGGSTGNGPRTGGLDGEGGFLALMHPQEVVSDLHGSAVSSPVAAAPPNITNIVALDAESINEAMATQRGAQVQIQNVRINRAQFRRALGI